MSYDSLVELISQTQFLKESNIIFIWHGGEPLLRGIAFYKKIVSLQKNIDKKFTNMIQTNATLLSAKFIDFFTKYNFSIGISIDGPQNISLNNRLGENGINTFEKIMRNIALMKTKGATFGVIAVLNDYAINDQTNLISFFENKIGADKLTFNLDYNISSSTNEKYHRKVVSFFHELYNKIKQDDLSLQVGDFIEIMNYLVPIHDSAECCSTMESFCGDYYNLIMPNGDIGLCCDRFLLTDYKDKIIGNIHKDSIRNLLYSKKVASIHAELQLIRKICVKECNAGDFCKGGCIAERLAGPSETIKEPSNKVSCVVKNYIFDIIKKDIHGHKNE